MTQKILFSIVEQYNLLKNPFYVAWSAGTLPAAALRTYASEYGNFLTLLPTAWGTLGDSETAQEEKDHAQKWQDFAKSIGASIHAPKYKETKELVSLAQNFFCTTCNSYRCSLCL